MNLRIASWNINSIRIRLDLVRLFVQKFRPHILCLQEIKCSNDLFPIDDICRMGYKHIALNGQKAYHGVAILSKLPLRKESRLFLGGKKDARHIAVNFKAGDKNVELHNFYVPAGGDIPDIKRNEKFAHKMNYLKEMTEWSGGLSKRNTRRLLVGDLNIAPLEEDVWNHKALLDVVSHTPQETEGLVRVQESHDWIDVARHFIPPPEKLYSWWSYRARDWSLSDRGRRLDHIWASRTLQPCLRSIEVAREVRGWRKPSDHVPVIAHLKL